MNFDNDKRTVMTLDAGGTNLVFAAIAANEQVLEEITIPTAADNLDNMLSSIVDGFNQVKNKLNDYPVAISFAFPGPADYPNGIIGDLQNLPCFRGGVALGPYLENIFKVPVYINNDGDLYAYGEALAGFLPKINKKLEDAGSPKRFNNLLGLTLGTGFGAGIVRNNTLYIGDNSGAGEICLLRNKLYPKYNVEESSSIRGVKRSYAKHTGIEFTEAPESKDIFSIAKGLKEGNKDAAISSFKEMAIATGDAISNAATLLDGLVVIGGGLSGASEVFLPFLVDEMNSTFEYEGSKFRRLAQNVYNLENQDDLDKFVKGQTKEIKIIGTDKTIKYDPEQKIGIGISQIGTSKAIFLGAYSYALSMLDN